MTVAEFWKQTQVDGRAFLTPSQDRITSRWIIRACNASRCAFWLCAADIQVEIRELRADADIATERRRTRIAEANRAKYRRWYHRRAAAARGGA